MNRVDQLEYMACILEHLPVAVDQGFVQVQYKGEFETRWTILLKGQKYLLLTLDLRNQQQYI